MLETTLRNFSCLTTGDSIMVAYNNKKYCIDIIETKPSNAVSIIERDCEVDFAHPLDYKEPEKPEATFLSRKAPVKGSSSQGTTWQTKGKLVFGSNVNNAKDPQKETAKWPKQEQPPEKDPKFLPFTGKKYSVRG